MAETRIRRGKVVTIPEEWRCVSTSHDTYKDRKDARILVRATRKRRLRVERDFDLNSQLDTDV